MYLAIKVKLQLKKYLENIHNEKIRINLLQAIPFWIASMLTGLLAFGYAKLFYLAEHSTFYLFDHWKWSLLIVSPICFITAWWLVKKFAPFSRGSGIPQVMAAIEISGPANNERVNKLLSVRIILVKIVSSLIMVFGGGAIGREGPTIQIAGSVFRKINLWLPEWWPKVAKKNMIMAGAAAGLAAAFNTPLGGIVFAVEELTKTHISFYKSALFSAVIIAGLTAQAFLGPYLYLGYPNISNTSLLLFPAIILVAAIAGIGASITCKIMLAIMNWKSKFKFNYQHFLFLLTCSLLMVFLAIFVNKNILGSGKDLMAGVLFSNDKYVPWYLPLLRIIGPVFSFTSGAAGGVFAPALSAGASIGSLFSGWFALTPANTNLLILSGMVAYLTGVTRSPFTSAILVLEMTDRHNVIFQLMLAAMVAGIASLIIDKHSFYDHLKRKFIAESAEGDLKLPLHS